MKRLLAYLTVLIFFGAFLLISACYIGLGSAVDTEAPEISIETPAVDVIIRDTFAISGTWSDDGTIDSITVLLERTDGNGSPITRDATFSITTGETGSGPWSCILDPSADSDKFHFLQKF